MSGPHELYVIRHAIAEPPGRAWPEDDRRPLTETGVARFRQSMRGLARLGVAFDVVLTSPLLRTRQTAEIAAAAFDIRPPVVPVDSLAPGGSRRAVMADLEKHSRFGRIALVGHEPGIGELAARLAGSPHAWPLEKGAICRIDIDGLPMSGPGVLRWLLTPRIMRRLR